ncbi:MAG: CtsR family transcriptional regulator [Streptococcaceae bacterium]|nr:CtsR family transcriptional regulator [Streptococcaceae bacterium]
MRSCIPSQINTVLKQRNQVNSPFLLNSKLGKKGCLSRLKLGKKSFLTSRKIARS